mmetsp:Transcript_10781/g.16054  ORF Transcript_10781/g.16054 Transcript_10781/m.16054 type:complete len:127 (-) Transcript_10781:239-619(-)
MRKRMSRNTDAEETGINLLDATRDSVDDYDRLSTHTDDEKSEGVGEREPFPYKEAFLAVVLTIGGLVFLPIGLYELLGRGDVRRGTPFLCISPFILLPGAYHLHILIRAYLGHRGYHYYQLVRRPH